MLKHLRDPPLYQQYVHDLPNRKSPGPDGIQNELLKHLPEEMHQVIHKMIILMWMTGHTPDKWKESCTILMHKKGNEHELGNWRPIALANTLYKLWTSMVTDCLTEHAEQYGALSSSQEGFRREKGTIRQLQNVMNVMSDAKICQQDLYLLYVDFSSAFNTIDHDKLLCIMYDLGFPADVIEIIKDLYTGAVTRVKLDFAQTDPIRLGRGTIQGDIPSPILSLIFIELLLRWLHSEGRGYRYGCLNKVKQHAEHRTSASTYADDLAAMASSHGDMREQAEKITAFVSWAGMQVNCNKCAITGMLYAQSSNDNVLSHGVVGMLQIRAAQVKIQGQSIPWEVFLLAQPSAGTSQPAPLACAD